MLFTNNASFTSTERLRITEDGAFGLSGANYGTSGQVLTSGGSGAAPTWTTVAAGLAAATQAEMEAATSNTVAVTPLSTNWHPGVAKVVLLTVGAGTPSIASSWNVTSITDQGVGELTVTIATDFSSTNYTVLATPGANSNSQAISVSVDNNNNPKTVGSFYIHGWNSSGSHAEPENGYNFACFGDQ